MIKIAKGFSLTEVLIVVVILAILASLVIPRFRGGPERGVAAEASGMLSAIRQAEESYRLEQTTPAYTATKANLDIGLTETNFTYAITVTGGASPTFTATATRQNTGINPCTNKTIVLNNAGLFSGTHPYGPKPNAGATC